MAIYVAFFTTQRLVSRKLEIPRETLKASASLSENIETHGWRVFLFVQLQASTGYRTLAGQGNADSGIAGVKGKLDFRVFHCETFSSEPPRACTNGIYSKT